MRLFALQINKRGALSLDSLRQGPKVFRTHAAAMIERRYIHGEIVCVSLTQTKVNATSRPVWAIVVRPLTNPSDAHYVDTLDSAPILFGTMHRAQTEVSVLDSEVIEKRYLTVLGRTVATPARIGES